MFPSLMFKGPGPYLILNSLVYSLVIIALAYLLTVLFKSKQVISGMGTVFSLGLAFITGVFIPQSVMKKEVLMLGRVFPSFYYVESNDKLVRLANFSFENMKSIYINMLIMLAFGLIFVVLSIIISNKKRQAEN
jgi:ABC-2 type transport system permease protein